MTFNAARLATELLTAREVAHAAGSTLRQQQAESYEASRKVGRDIVTAADVHSEQFIAAELQQAFPQYGILGEEATRRESSDSMWIVDPLDGTVNYAAGLPLYSVSIGLRRDDETVCGVIDVPALSEQYAAARGGGAACNEQPIQVSDTRDASDAVIAVMLAPHYEAPFAAQVARLIGFLSDHVRGVRLMVSQAVELAWVAGGRLDATLALRRSAHGFSSTAGILIVEESGGRVSDIHGQPLPSPDAKGMLATNGVLHSVLTELIANGLTVAEEVR